VARVQGEQGFMRGILRARSTAAASSAAWPPDGTFELSRFD
jgi:hypothetical protein